MPQRLPYCPSQRRRAPRILRCLFFAALVISGLVWAAASADASSPHVDVLTVDGEVNPTLANYLHRGINHAEKDGAEACIIELDTPGGLLSSTQEITDRILDADVPVVVYVSRWAGSAGTFITLSADVAAMAPGSTIGAAHPVGDGGKELSETMDMKVTEDAVAHVRSFAAMHGRNADAAEAMVRQALSFSDQEALGISPLSRHSQEELGVERLDPPLVDVGAGSLDDLVRRLGEGITLADHSAFSIPSDVKVNHVHMSASERFLYAISDPNIAYILVSIGMLGIIAELFHPGMILPGVLGGVCLILGIYSLDMLEANWAGLALIALAMVLFVVEMFTPTHGVLAAGGVVSLVLGSVVLFGGTPYEVDRRLIAGVVLAFAGLLIYITIAVVRSRREPVTTGQEGLLGQTGVTRTVLDPEGNVFVQGELWRAVAEDDRIGEGEQVVVNRVKGLKVWVTKKPG